MTKLTLIRGLPGSGKSTLAKEYHEATPGSVWVEADHFHVVDGVYKFDARNIGPAHSRCQVTACDALKAGKHVIVSNTFVRLWEMEPYIEYAKLYGAEWEIIECKGEYGNIHGCSADKVELMRKAWEECDKLRHPNDKHGLPLDVQLDELYIEDAHLRDGDSPQ